MAAFTRPAHDWTSEHTSMNGDRPYELLLSEKLLIVIVGCYEKESVFFRGVVRFLRQLERDRRQKKTGA